MFERGNQNVVLDNPDLVNKILDKEDRYSHLVPLHDWVCRFGPHLWHKSQGIIDLKRLIWDKSTNISALDLVLNDLTPADDETEITFGTAKGEFKKHIYNPRANFPYTILLLALVDIKACFRFPRIHPNLTGAFGFLPLGCCNGVCLQCLISLLGNSLQSYWGSDCHMFKPPWPSCEPQEIYRY